MAPTPVSNQLSTMQPAAKTFIDLPPELRVKIYQEVLAKIKVKQTATWPSRNRRPLTDERGRPMEETVFRYRFRPRHPLAILAVSKDISREARPISESCPILIESSTSGHLSKSFHFPPLPEAAKRQILSIVTDINHNDFDKVIPFGAEEQYPNLRKLELNGNSIVVSIAEHIHQKLLDTKVRDCEDSDEIYDRAMQALRSRRVGEHLLKSRFTVKFNLFLEADSTSDLFFQPTDLLGTIVVSGSRVHLAHLTPYSESQEFLEERLKNDEQKRW